MRVIRVSKLFKIIIYFLTLYILGFDKIIALPGSTFVYDIIIVLLGVGLALYVNQKCLSNQYLRSQCKELSNYLRLYFIIVVITMIYSMIAYGYSLTQLLIISRKYFFVLYAYPIVYIFSMDDDMFKFINGIYWISMVLLAIKTVTWYLYNFKGMTIFSGLLLQYSEGWTRNGLVRLDAGALFGITLCLTLYYCMVKKQLFYWIMLAFIYFYLIFVTQFRFQIIVSIVITVYCYYYASNSSKKKAIRLMIISLAIIIFILSGGLDYLLGLFSLNGVEKGSTEARLLTIEHYWSLIKRKNAILGVGFLSSYTSKAFDILRRSDTDRFWLEDLGILGGFFTFGVMALALYGKLFYASIKKVIDSCSDRMTNYESCIFVKSIVLYMIISCVLLNIFDAQRIWGVPFYLSIIFFSENASEKIVTKESTRHIRIKL